TFRRAVYCNSHGPGNCIALPGDERKNVRSMNVEQGRLKIGFIGAGGIAERHVGVLCQMKNVDITGIADSDFGRAGELAGRLGANAYNSHTDLIAMEDLDAVYICVPPFAHGLVEAAVIAAALPFFVEKPLSL